ncbi:MAG: hypothetical protein A2X46_06530 [Lentisphaerae bacterium GWF2_57_35]|nr:MAG: hypothetical protein A2X46_06530 [Lentisphaerae bacterium GWF2_57_35]
MKITFILPCVGKKAGRAYPRSWLMEPLAIAQLAALTPKKYDRVFYDDRLESIPYDEKTDLVAISVETYTARRAYQIASHFRKKNIPVVMGGFHATLAPDEVEQHADVVVMGEAEGVWEYLLRDFEQGNLQKRYQAEKRPELMSILPDRSIYGGRRYLDLALVETGRGCRFSCEFCSIAGFFNGRYAARPVDDVVREIQRLKTKSIFFVDDNIAVDRQRTVKLLEALTSLGIRWIGQVSMSIANDDELLALFYRSGCLGLLIGFESFEKETLDAMRKQVNCHFGDYDSVVQNLHKHKLAIYGTFVFGYDSDTNQTFQRTLDFVVKNKLFFAAFNHLVPFPGTPLYQRLREQKQLVQDDWWLSPSYRFGDVALKTKNYSAQDLSDRCLRFRKEFYTMKSILWRATNVKANCKSPFMTLTYFMANLLSRGDVVERQGLPLGFDDNRKVDSE